MEQKLDGGVLRRGGHDSRDEGMYAAEADMPSERSLRASLERVTGERDEATTYEAAKLAAEAVSRRVP